MKTKLISPLNITILLFICLFAFPLQSYGTRTEMKMQKRNYIFSYFTSGQDGLHLLYSKDALNWKYIFNGRPIPSTKPILGNSRFMRDPCIIKGPDNKFHMVFGYGHNEQGIGITHSDDLINWSKQELIPVMKHEPKTVNCWAPEIYWDDLNEQYMIYWASTIPGKFPKTDYLDKASWSPVKWYNHRMYYTTTKDFKTYSVSKLLYDGGFNVIDGSIQKIKDNQYIMFIKNENQTPVPNKSIYYLTSNNPIGPWKNLSKAITPTNWVEGPTAIKIGNVWQVMYDKYSVRQYGTIRSTNLIDWVKVPMKLPSGSKVRHGTIFTVTSKELSNLKKL